MSSKKRVLHIGYALLTTLADLKKEGIPLSTRAILHVGFQSKGFTYREVTEAEDALAAMECVELTLGTIAITSKGERAASVLEATVLAAQ